MKLNEEQLIELTKVAIDAAIKAGQLIADHTGRKDFEIEKKETGASLASQVVTEVDRMSQEIVLKTIYPTCIEYDLGMLAEESEDDGSRFEKDYFWCIDPMDGTLPFIEDREGYAVSIGLVSREGVPYIGVVCDPRADVVYYATRGVGAFRNNEPWSLSNATDDSYEEIDRGGAVMNTCWVLESPSAYFCKNPKERNGGGCVWDYAATACLFEVLGAWVSDIYGNPLELNRHEAPYMNHKGVLFASHEKIAKNFLKQA